MSRIVVLPVMQVISGTPVAVGFRAQKANDKYRYFRLYRVKFGVPATNLKTKGYSISFQTPAIEDIAAFTFKDGIIIETVI